MSDSEKGYKVRFTEVGWSNRRVGRLVCRRYGSYVGNSESQKEESTIAEDQDEPETQMRVRIA